MEGEGDWGKEKWEGYEGKEREERRGGRQTEWEGMGSPSLVAPCHCQGDWESLKFLATRGHLATLSFEHPVVYGSI